MWTSTLKKGLFLIGGLFLGGAVHAQYLRTLWKEQVHACS